MTATQTPSGPWAYKVQDQESPICLARRFNVDPDVLFALNILDINSVVQAGQEILIPAPGTPWSDKYGSRVLAAHPTTYVVQPNDTIYSIACYFGDVSPEIIAYTNGLEPPYTLTSGQILNIP
jgi:LysM repeat protein